VATRGSASPLGAKLAFQVSFGGWMTVERTIVRALATASLPPGTVSQHRRPPPCPWG
jgi:hypothetical protein